jgi:hypothetical protein
MALVDALIGLFNGGAQPCIPSKGSVGASGDLAPLAHLAAALIGAGDVRTPCDWSAVSRWIRRAWCTHFNAPIRRSSSIGRTAAFRDRGVVAGSPIRMA